MTYTRTELANMSASEVRELALMLDLEYVNKTEAIELILASESTEPTEDPLVLEPEPIPNSEPACEIKPVASQSQYPTELLTRLGQPLCRTCGAPKATDRYGQIVCAAGNSDTSQCLFK